MKRDFFNIIIVLSLTLALLAAGSHYVFAAAASPTLKVQIVYAAKGEPKVDPRLKPLQKRLNQLFDFTQYQLENEQTLTLNVGQKGTLILPDGKPLSLTPVQKQRDMWKITLSIPKLVQSDILIRDGHMVILGGARYKKGVMILVIQVNPDLSKPTTD